MAVMTRLWRLLRREHDCYWRRQYDTFNAGYRAEVRRAAELQRERDAVLREWAEEDGL